MSKTHYVYSTLSNDNWYQNYNPGGADLPVAEGGVLIRGGANIPDKRLITPMGVANSVTTEELEYLRANHVFKVHEKNGFIRVSDKKADPEVVAADMEGRDVSAPIVPEDFTAEGETPPVQGDAKPVAPAADRPANPRRA
jgi:hypothetical protein